MKLNPMSTSIPESPLMSPTIAKRRARRGRILQGLLGQLLEQQDSAGKPAPARASAQLLEADSLVKGKGRRVVRPGVESHGVEAELAGEPLYLCQQGGRHAAPAKLAGGGERIHVEAGLGRSGTRATARPVDPKGPGPAPRRDGAQRGAQEGVS